MLATILLLVVFSAYSPALRGGYIWTDWANVRGYPGLSALGELRRIWASCSTEQYFPLAYTSFWLERLVWGHWPTASHVVNVTLHLLNALLVVQVLRRLGVPGAWFGAAIFALHPVHVESVAWIVERKNLLSGVFYLLAVLYYLRSDEERRGRAYWYSLGLFALALLSKSSTVMLPVAVVLCRWYLRRPWSRSDIGRIVPLFAMSCVMALVSIGYEHAKNPFLAEKLEVGLTDRVALVGLNTWFYVGKLVAPVHLSLVYEKGELRPLSVWSYLPIVGVLTALLVLWMLRGRWGHGPLLASLFYVATLFPVLGVFPFFYQKMSYVADHFQYLPSLGLITLFAATTGHWLGRWRRSRGGMVRVLGWTGAGGVLLLLGIMTWTRCHVYKDNYTIWLDALDKSPDSWAAHAYFARAALRRGETDTAIAHFQEEIKRRRLPHPRPHLDLGQVYTKAGRLHEAEASFRAAIAAEPRFAEAHLRLGDTYSAMKRFEKAVEAYEAALLRNPRWPIAHRRLAGALRALGRHEEADEHRRKAEELSPRRGPAGES